MTPVASRAILVCCEVRTDNQPGCRPFANKTVSVRRDFFCADRRLTVNGHNIPEEQKPYIFGPASRQLPATHRLDNGRSSY